MVRNFDSLSIQKIINENVEIKLFFVKSVSFCFILSEGYNIWISVSSTSLPNAWNQFCYCWDFVFVGHFIFFSFFREDFLLNVKSSLTPEHKRTDGFSKWTRDKSLLFWRGLFCEHWFTELDCIATKLEKTSSKLQTASKTVYFSNTHTHFIFFWIPIFEIIFFYW